nr:unnamed protein product [Callosobruchus analis]
MKQVHKQPISMNSEENKRNRAEYVTALNRYIELGKQLYGLMKKFQFVLPSNTRSVPSWCASCSTHTSCKGSQCTPNRCNISSRGCDNGTSQRLFFIGIC